MEITTLESRRRHCQGGFQEGNIPNAGVAAIALDLIAVDLKYFVE